MVAGSYDDWKTTEPFDPYDEPPVEEDVDPLDCPPEWILELDEEDESDVEVRAEAFMTSLQWGTL